VTATGTITVLPDLAPHGRGNGDARIGWFAAYVLAALACLFVLSSNAPAQGGNAFPKLTGRVVDGANLLDPATKQAMIRKLAEFEKQSSDQVVVATIKSLQGNSLEEYANGLFRLWQLGQAEENNGVLLLVAKEDRKIRIEVGYGLEGTLTDALSKLIIDSVIVPQFRNGDFAAGISQGGDQIIAVLSGDAAELTARQKRNVERRNSPQTDWPGIVFMTIFFTLFFGTFGFAILAPIFGKKLGPGRYKWLGIEIKPGSGRSGSGGSGWSGGSSGGGFSGGGGSSGGGGASGSW